MLSAPLLCAVLVGDTVTPIRLLVVAAVWKNKPLSVCLSVSVFSLCVYRCLSLYELNDVLLSSICTDMTEF